MVTANSDAYRRNFTALEEASALFAAHEAGATRTRIRRATGRKLPQVKAALDAGRLSAGAREQVAGLDRQLTLDELALMAEFEPDRDALSQLLDAARYGYALEHIAERIRLDRAEAAEHEKISAALEASGCPVTADLPGGASLLTGLLHDGADITAESHRDCPGHGAYFRSYDLKEPVYYCAVPAANGHVSRWAAQAAATYDTGTGGGLGWAGADAGDTAVEAGGGLEDGPGSLVSSVREVPDPEAEAARRLIVEGDKAWAAAAEVRRRWVAQLLARRAAPPQAARFTAAQLLLMPQVLRQALTAAPGRALFTELTGRSADAAAAECGICPAGRIALLMLAPVAVAFESQMAGPDERRGTWRVSRWAPCPRHEAGTWLRFLADLGYQMSAIEQAVADDQPWTGDAPAEPDREEPGADDPDAAPAEPPTGDTDGIAAGEAGSAGEPEGYPGEAA
jgi:ParB family chromosome partitioning protein